MSFEPLLSVVLRTLAKHGPQDFQGLVRLIETDPDFGFIALRTDGFEAQVRECLKRRSPDGLSYFRHVPDYKWSIADRSVLDELCLPEIEDQSPWLSMGSGNELVYALFFPSILSRISAKEKALYPVKIGRTRRDVSNRFAELQTGNFEDLKLGILIRTDNSISLESFLHEHLSHTKMYRRNNQSE